MKMTFNNIILYLDNDETGETRRFSIAQHKDAKGRIIISEILETTNDDFSGFAVHFNSTIKSFQQALTQVIEQGAA